MLISLPSGGRHEHRKFKHSDQIQIRFKKNIFHINNKYRYRYEITHVLMQDRKRQIHQLSTGSLIKYYI